MATDDRVSAARLEVDDDGDALGLLVVDARQPGESFARARLVDVELVRCDLSGCDFSEGVWERVTLVDCRASAIELPQTGLRNVSFTGCKLDEMNLRLARLRDVRFADSILADAELMGAQLEDVSFAGCDLARADFSKARCSTVDLGGARLEGLRGVASLAGATIEVDQLIGLAPALAVAVGLRIRTQDAASPPDRTPEP